MTGNQTSMVTFAAVKGKLEYETLETRLFVARHGRGRFRMNPHFPLNTILVMRGAVAAEREGRLIPYVGAILPAMCEHAAEMDDPTVFQAVLAKAGLTGLYELTTDEAVKSKLTADTQAAV